jgi:hypothetical protein
MKRTDLKDFEHFQRECLLVGTAIKEAGGAILEKKFRKARSTIPLVGPGAGVGISVHI